MLKNLLRKKFREVESINGPYEGSKRQTINKENFERFITTCKKELKETGTCMCFTLEQVNNIIDYYGDHNLYYEPVDYYYVIKPKRYVLVQLPSGEVIHQAITSPIHMDWIVLRYE